MKSTQWSIVFEAGLVLVALGALCGCRDTVYTPAEPPKTGPEVAPLKELKRELSIEKQANHVTAMNAGSYVLSARRFQRQEDELMMWDRIPLGSATSAEMLRKQLEESAVVAAVTIEGLEVRAAEPAPRALPTRTPGAFRWEPGDLVATHAVHFQLGALSRTRVRRWWAGLPKHLPRLLLLKTMSEKPGG